METIAESLSTPVAGRYDVIVCGGGPAGVGAAVAAIDRAKVTVSNCDINVNGVTRCAIHAVDRRIGEPLFRSGGEGRPGAGAGGPA